MSIDPKHTYKTFGVAALIALLAGCSTMPRDILKPTDVEKTYDADMPRPTFNYDEAVTEIPIFDDLVPQRLDRSEAIPRMVIGGVSASGRTSAEALLLALLAGTRMSATFDGAAARKTGFVATRLSGQLETIVDDIADRLDIWYSYRGGVFRFKESERFSVKVPPVFTPEQTTAIENTLKAFGAADIIFDPSTYLLMYRASPGEQDAIEQYLEVLRSREMLVYDVYVYEVALSDSAALGINWQQFNYQRGDGSLSLNGGSLASNALSLTGTFAGDNFSLTQLVTFLQSQGSVRTVSQPKISVMTGQTASFVVGQIERILSKVGATVGSGFSTVTTETEDLETGLRVLLRGGYRAGRVWTEVHLTQSDQLQGREVSIGDTTVFLPKVTNRDVRTSIASRPGDAILLSGLIQTRESEEAEGAPSVGGRQLPTRRSTDNTHGEMVMVMRPRVVRFVADQDPSSVPMHGGTIEVGPETSASEPASARTTLPTILREVSGEQLLREQAAAEAIVRDQREEEITMLRQQLEAASAREDELSKMRQAQAREIEAVRNSAKQQAEAQRMQAEQLRAELLAQIRAAAAAPVNPSAPAAHQKASGADSPADDSSAPAASPDLALDASTPLGKPTISVDPAAAAEPLAAGSVTSPNSATNKSEELGAAEALPQAPPVTDSAKMPSPSNEEQADSEQADAPQPVALDLVPARSGPPTDAKAPEELKQPGQSASMSESPQANAAAATSFPMVYDDDTIAAFEGVKPREGFDSEVVSFELVSTPAKDVYFAKAIGQALDVDVSLKAPNRVLITVHGDARFSGEAAAPSGRVKAIRHLVKGAQKQRQIEIVTKQPVAPKVRRGPGGLIIELADANGGAGA